MKFLTRLKNFLKAPPVWLQIVLYAAAVAACFGVLWLTSLGAPAFPVSVAVYAFYAVSAAIVHFFKTRKMPDLRLRAVRGVNLADALVSVFALQTAMFREFSPELEVGAFNALTGFAVCGLTAAIGIFMLLNAVRQGRRAKREAEQRAQAADALSAEGKEEDGGR